MKLNLGCGQRKVEGYVNIDKYDTFTPDIVHDLEVTPWPFEDGSVTEILATHVLEHLGGQTDVFLAIMQELYRIMAPGAVIKIIVPHHRSDGFWGDPTHVRAININVLSLFSKASCRMFKERNWPNTPLADYLDVDFEVTGVNAVLTQAWSEKLNAGMPEDEIQYAMATYSNVVDETRFDLRRGP